MSQPISGWAWAGIGVVTVAVVGLAVAAGASDRKSRKRLSAARSATPNPRESAFDAPIKRTGWYAYWTANDNGVRLKRRYGPWPSKAAAADWASYDLDDAERRTVHYSLKYSGRS